MLRLERPVVDAPIYMIGEHMGACFVHSCDTSSTSHEFFATSGHPDNVEDGDRGLVVGSGADSESPPWTGSGVQREGTVTVNFVASTLNLHILARGTGGTAVCAGDSGGPLFVEAEVDGQVRLGHVV
eukprot:SAG11_NODE_1363_length_5110_cov_7.005588_3_plen_127_part_00